MTLRLILIRHAKSSWSNPQLADKDRPLNKRGRASAKAIGRWLSTRSHEPGQVLVSSAARTRETWAKVADKMVSPPEAHYMDALYLADPDQMTAILKQADKNVVMMIAHNPGCAQFAQTLVKQAPEHGRFTHYPTGATAIIDFPVDSWSDVQWGTGEAVDFIVPRELI